MADEAIKTLAVKIALEDGSFQDGIKNLNKSIKVVESEFKASTAGVKDWGKSLDGLKANAQALSDKINIQKQIISSYDAQLKKSHDTMAANAQKMTDIKAKLDAARQAYDQSKSAVGANDDATKKLKEDLDKLQKQYNSAESVVRKNNASVQNYTVKLNESKASLKGMEAELKTANEAINKQTSSLKKLSEQAGKTGEKLKTVGGKISEVGGTLTMGLTAPVVAAGVAAFKLSSDLTEATNKVNTAFGASSSSVIKWSDTTLEKIGLAKGTALDMAAAYGDMATSMGGTTGAASELGKQLVERAADMSSYKNISIEVANTGMAGIFTGETESLKKLGVVMTEANLKQYMLSKGYRESYDSLTQWEKVQLRAQYVLDATKNAAGDFARTNQEAAGQMRIFTQTGKELGETFGNEIVPALNPVLKTINSLLKEFGKLDDGTKKTIVTAAAFAAVAGPIISGVGNVVKVVGGAGTVFSKFTAHMAAAKAATVAETAAAGSAAVATKGLGAAFASIAGPITAGIALLAAFGLAYQHNINETVALAKKHIDEEYDTKIDKNNKELQNNLNNLEAEKTALQNSLLARQKNIDAYYDKQIKNAETSLKAQKKSLDNENKAYKDAYDERIKLLEAEKKAKLAAIDNETKAQIDPLQQRIDAIDSQTAAEDKAIKDKENAQKLSNLRAAVYSAKNDEDKKIALKNLNDFIAQLSREKLLNEREIEKSALLDKIEKIKSESEKRKDAVNEEIENQKELAEKTLKTQQQSVQDRLEALDGYVERARGKYEAERQNAKAVEEAKTADLAAQIDERIKHYQDLTDAANKALEAEKAEKEERSKKDIEKPIPPSEAAQYYLNPKKAPGGAIPVAANGNSDFDGGLIRVNEEGGEILNLPRHTQIIPHDVSMEMARSMGSGSTVTNNYYPATISVPIYLNGTYHGTQKIQLTAQQLKQLQNDRGA